jgi:integrase/recombinase XerD
MILQSEGLCASRLRIAIAVLEERFEELSIRSNVLILLLIYQGLASDEIVRLTIKDIDLDNGTIYIKGSTNLNKRTMELVPKQMILFYNYINETYPELLKRKTDKFILTKLGSPITVDSIHVMIERLRGLFPDRKLNPQTIRMSMICNWLNEISFWKGLRNF